MCFYIAFGIIPNYYTAIFVFYKLPFKKLSLQLLF